MSSGLLACEGRYRLERVFLSRCVACGPRRFVVVPSGAGSVPVTRVLTRNSSDACAIPFSTGENRTEVIRYVLRPVPVFVDPSSGSLEGVSPQPMQPNSSSLSGCIRSRIKSNWGNPGTISQTSSPNRSSRRTPPLRSVKSGVFFVVILLVPL